MGQTSSTGSYSHSKGFLWFLWAGLQAEDYLRLVSPVCPQSEEDYKAKVRLWIWAEGGMLADDSLLNQMLVVFFYFFWKSLHASLQDNIPFKAIKSRKK